MPVPRDVKGDLVERFTPLLYLRDDDRDFPVDPAAYARAAALWTSRPPWHTRRDWGVAGSSPGERRPNVARGDLDPDAFPPNVPGGREAWLDAGAWTDGEGVGAGTRNVRAGSLEPDTLAQPWFSSDVWMLGDLVASHGTEAMGARFGFGAEEVPDDLADVVVVAFHFLFPLHRQPRADVALAPEDDPWTGDFQGDWTAFAVACRAPAASPDGWSGEDCTPFAAGYGQRWRAFAADEDEQVFESVRLQPWADVQRERDHAVVRVAAGTHNLHPADVPTVTPTGGVKPAWIPWGVQQSEPANKVAREAAKSPWHALFAAKVLAGLAVGGVIGAIGGVLGAAAEASWAHEEGLYGEVELDPHPAPSATARSRRSRSTTSAIAWRRTATWRSRPGCRARAAAGTGRSARGRSAGRARSSTTSGS